MSRRLWRLVVVAVVLAGCGPQDASSDNRSSGTARAPAGPTDLVRAQTACADGDIEAGLAEIDAALRANETADALVARALCRWVRFDETGAEADGEAVEDDLTSALAQARADNAGAAALSRIYSHRAALRRARGASWPATLADLDAATADTTRPVYVLDRAVARAQRGDSAAAVRDLDRYLVLDSLDTARIEFARELRDEVRPRSARR